MNKKIPVAVVAADICTEVKSDNLYKGMKCLPGALIAIDENAEDTIVRVLKERTNLLGDDVYVEQLYSFSEIQRDKRSRSVSIAYMGLMDIGADYASTDTPLGKFMPLSKVKNLAFDHKEVITLAHKRLRSKVLYSTIIKKLVREKFTFSLLQQCYEIVLGKALDKRNFRKKITALNLIKETGEQKKEGRMRPAMLYRWSAKDVEFYDVLGFAIRK
jgi:8-oxo-dGTP diphosphatase